MGGRSAIEWTDATWNPVTGCTKVSPGCKHCYAERLAARLQMLGNPRYRRGFDVTLHPDQLILPLRWRQPRRIFVNSMSDLFHESVPEEFIQKVFEIMVQAPWHIFQILTKRAQRLADLSPQFPWPPNVWQGVSVENAHYTWRIDYLQKVPAIVRFLSIEPFLGPIETLPLDGIHWVIVGGESGPRHRPMNPVWVRRIRDQCVATGVPFFFKQWGGLTSKSRGRLLDGEEWNEVPSKRSPMSIPSEKASVRINAANSQFSGEAMQTESRARKGTPWHEAFFDGPPRLTSKVKHLVLQSYVKEFVYHLGSVRRILYYIDGFAGPGIYPGAAGEIEYGSPVRIAEFGRQLRESDKPFTLKCLNVEANRQRYQRLREATAAFHDQIVEKNYLASFTDVLGDILRRIGDAPAFFFLDPFGVKDIPFGDLLPLFNRRERTEVFITLHTDGMAKKAGWFAHLDDADMRERKKALGLVENVAKALHLSRDELYSWWIKCGGKEGNGWTSAFEQRVLKRYRTMLRVPNTRFQFTKAFPVHYYRPDAPPGEKAPICFYLVFGTQNEEGLYEMNDCMLRALKQFYKQEYSHTLFPSFDEEPEEPQQRSRLQQEILTRFPDTTFTINQAKQHLMQESLLLVTRGEYRKAVIGLKQAGRLQQLDPGNASNESTRFRVIKNLPQQVSAQLPLLLR
jgi:three-Cys-motif partner protein